MAANKKARAKGKKKPPSKQTSVSAKKRKAPPSGKQATTKKSPSRKATQKAKAAPAARRKRPTSVAKAAKRAAPKGAPAVRGKRSVAAPHRELLKRAPSPKPQKLVEESKPPERAIIPNAPARSTDADSTPPGERVGVVTHYFSDLAVAVIRLETGTLRVGDTIHIKGHTTDFTQRVDSLQVNHAAVDQVGPQDDFGIKVIEHAREHDAVYKVS